MPLLHHKQFSPEPVPLDLKPTDKVFFCPLTKEIFTNYEWVYILLDSFAVLFKFLYRFWVFVIDVGNCIFQTFFRSNDIVQQSGLELFYHRKVKHDLPGSAGSWKTSYPEFYWFFTESSGHYFECMTGCFIVYKNKLKNSLTWMYPKIVALLALFKTISRCTNNWISFLNCLISMSYKRWWNLNVLEICSLMHRILEFFVDGTDMQLIMCWVRKSLIFELFRDCFCECV